jgi:hypothetical protein
MQQPAADILRKISPFPSSNGRMQLLIQELLSASWRL